MIMKEVENIILSKMQEIKSALIENGYSTEYLALNINNGNISFNNEYWKDSLSIKYSEVDYE